MKLVNRKLVALLLMVIIALSLAFWASERIETHRNWLLMSNSAQRFNLNMNTAVINFQGAFQNTSSQEKEFFMTAIAKAHSEIIYLIDLDPGHSAECEKILVFLTSLQDTALIGLNETARSNLEMAINNIGDKVMHAYTGVLTSPRINEVSFWYVGPAPPDEVLLQEAVGITSQATIK